jgi:hypothetical protein
MHLVGYLYEEYYEIVPMKLSKRRIVIGAIWCLMWNVTRQVNSTDFNRINWPHAWEQVALITVPLYRATSGEFPGKNLREFAAPSAH